MIYGKMMTLPIGNVNESSAMSIMGSDVETLSESFFKVICDTWANCIQLAIAIWLLASQLGAVCVAPIIVAVGTLQSKRTVTAWLQSLHCLVLPPRKESER